MAGKTPGNLPNEAREGRYANYFNVGHNAFEVILDLGQFFEGDADPRMHTRILMTPAYARSLCDLLHASLLKYEQAFGPIPSGEIHD